MKLAWISCAVLISTTAGAWAQVVDLTHSFDRSTIYWPTATPFTLTVKSKGATPGGWWYESNDFSACEHGGTHLDAPCHFAKGRWTVDQIPLESLQGPAAVVDISERAQANPDAVLEVADLVASDKRDGKIETGSIVILRTGWHKRWPDKLKYMGTDRPGDVKGLHFPSFSAPAAQWLVARGVKLVGVDTASIDAGTSTTFPCHVIFGAASVPGLENLANLDQLPARGAEIIALPMKIGGGSGAPCRVMARLRSR